MRRNLLSTIAILLFCLFFFTGCSNASTVETPAIGGLPTAETPTIVELPTAETTATAVLPEPTLMAASTQAPPPQPCMIAFDSDRDGDREIYLMGPDGKDPVNLSNNPADDWDPAWSPEGSQIAFVSNRENGKDGGQFIYVMRADGSEVGQLTTDPNSNFPDWSHDSSRITYTSNEDIYVVNSDGSGPSINLTNSPEKDEWPSWSPDSSQIAWLSGSDGNWNIFLMNADGSNVRQLTENGKVLDFKWTVDGQIFTHWDNQEAGCFNCVMDADGSNIINAGGKGEIQRYLPFWTWDGNRVECVEGSLNGGDNEIYLVGEVFPDIFLNLTHNPANDRNPDWPANCGPGTKVAVPEINQTKDPSKIVIGYAGDDPWQNQRKDNFQKACAELAVQCVYGEIPELIEQGVDAIVQNSNNSSVQGLHQDILNARDKGIPVFLLDAESITDGAYSITINHQEWASISLEWMFKNMGGEGDFTYFDFQPYNGHTAVIEDMLNKYPGVKVVAQRDGKYDFSQIKVDVGEIMGANPNLGAIWSSKSMSDVVFGVADTGIPSEKWPLLMCEATKEGLFIWKDRLKEHPGMRCIAVSNPPGIAYDAVYAAFYLITGSKIDESVLGGPYGHTLYVDIPVITNDNLQEWLDRINFEDVKYMVDERMEPAKIKEIWFLE
jgi:ABC-type sugar transport system substrate-binding protein